MSKYDFISMSYWTFSVKKALTAFTLKDYFVLKA